MEVAGLALRPEVSQPLAGRWGSGDRPGGRRGDPLLPPCTPVAAPTLPGWERGWEGYRPGSDPGKVPKCCGKGMRRRLLAVSKPEEANAGGRRLQCWNLRSGWIKDEAFRMRTRVDVRWAPPGAAESAVMRKGLVLLK